MHLIKLNATDSTNDALRILLSKNHSAKPTIVWALHQKNGKGQSGNVWTSSAGENLTFSLCIPSVTLPVDQLFELNKQVAVCLASWFLLHKIKNIYVKWPNDILSGNQKIAGILIETSVHKAVAKSIVIGIGINVNQLYFPNLPHAVSMRSITKINYDLEELLLSVTDRLVKTLSLPFKAIDESYTNLLYGRNQKRTFRTQNSEFEGTILDVTPEGKLRIQTQNGERQFAVKELQFVHISNQ